jgi:hypothetical protein
LFRPKSWLARILNDEMKLALLVIRRIITMIAKPTRPA